MILRYIEISLGHSTAISLLADRIEHEARCGRAHELLRVRCRIDGEDEIGCVHVGDEAQMFMVGRRWGKSAQLAKWRPTPFGMCSSRLVAAELTLRQTFALDRLVAARARGFDIPYLHVWEQTQ